MPLESTFKVTTIFDKIAKLAELSTNGIKLPLVDTSALFRASDTLVGIGSTSALQEFEDEVSNRPAMRQHMVCTP